MESSNEWPVIHMSSSLVLCRRLRLLRRLFPPLLPPELFLLLLFRLCPDLLLRRRLFPDLLLLLLLDSITSPADRIAGVISSESSFSTITSDSSFLSIDSIVFSKILDFKKFYKYLKEFCD